VNLANALQESAPPGKILLTDEAYHEVEDYVEVRPISHEELKEDLDEPVQVYGLLKLL
jgi:class 3 adenylate cyclase